MRRFVCDEPDRDDHLVGAVAYVFAALPVEQPDHLVGCVFEVDEVRFFFESVTLDTSTHEWTAVIRTLTTVDDRVLVGLTPEKMARIREILQEKNP